MQQIVDREQLSYLAVDAVVASAANEFPTGTLPALADGQIYVLLDVAAPNAAWGTLPVGVANGDIIERIGGAWVLKITAVSRQVGEKVFSTSQQRDFVFIGAGTWVDGREKTIGLFDIIQTNTFNVGDVVYYDDAGSSWELAQADAATTLGLGIIGKASGEKFDVIFSGEIAWTHGIAALNRGVYLSPTTAGAATSSRPSSAGQFIQQVGRTETDDLFVVAFGWSIGADELGGGAGGSFDYEQKTADFTTTGGAALLLNSAGGAITITLNDAPSLGERVRLLVQDNTNSITIDGNGNQIQIQEHTIANTIPWEIKGDVLELAYIGNNIWEGTRVGEEAALSAGVRNIQVSNVFTEFTPLWYNPNNGVWNISSATATGFLPWGYAVNVTPDSFDLITAGAHYIPAHGFTPNRLYFLTDTAGVFDTDPGSEIFPAFWVLDDNVIQIFDPHLWRTVGLLQPSLIYLDTSGGLGVIGSGQQYYADSPNATLSVTLFGGLADNGFAVIFKCTPGTKLNFQADGDTIETDGRECILTVLRNNNTWISHTVYTANRSFVVEVDSNLTIPSDTFPSGTQLLVTANATIEAPAIVDSLAGDYYTIHVEEGVSCVVNFLTGTKTYRGITSVMLHRTGNVWEVQEISEGAENLQFRNSNFTITQTSGTKYLILGNITAALPTADVAGRFFDFQLFDGKTLTFNPAPTGGATWVGEAGGAGGTNTVVRLWRNSDNTAWFARKITGGSGGGGGTSVTVGTTAPAAAPTTEGALYYDKNNAVMYIGANVGGLKWFQLTI